MRIWRHAVWVLLGLGLATCASVEDPLAHIQPSQANLTIFDKTGAVVMVAYVEFPEPVPSLGAKFSGRWRLFKGSAWYEDHFSFRGDAMEGAVYDATRWADGTFHFNLNPRVFDNNIALVGVLTGNLISGRFEHLTFVTNVPMGIFTLKLAPESSR